MKKTVLTGLLLIAALFASCSFLDEKVESSSLPGNYYKNAVQCRSGLNGCYIPLRSIYASRSYFWLTEAQGDLLYTEQADQYDGILQITQSQPQYGATVWNNCYSGIMRSNAMMDAIASAPFEEGKPALLAECTILRAMFYYILTCTFGDVPFYEEAVTDAENDRIASLPRTSASVIRDSLISEIRYWVLEKEALDMVPTYSRNNSSQYRMGAAAGLMIAAKMCMWDGRWNEAVELYCYLEKMYGDLSDYPLADIKFRNRYTAESIWEIPFSADDYGLQIYHNLATVCMPGHTYVSQVNDEDDYDNATDYYAGIAVPELGKYARNITATRPTKKLYNSSDGLLPYNAGSGDKRACTSNSTGEIEDGEGCLAWGWIGWSQGEDRTVLAPHWNWFSGMSAASRPYLGDKFWCFDMKYQSDDNNLKVFRYAGVVLDLAEAWIRKGDRAKACEYLNKVKARAGLRSYEETHSEAEILAEIQNECGRELLGEFQRKYDLVRWGIWYETVKASRETNGVANSNFLQNLSPCHRFYPIPSEQITYSHGALSNPEYTKYGK